MNRKLFSVILIMGFFLWGTGVFSGEEIIMEEGTQPATTSVEKSSAPAPVSGSVTTRSGGTEEEIFEEGGPVEEEKPAGPGEQKMEKEMKNIPPSTSLEEEFQEEESGNLVVTDEELQRLEEKINQLRNQILDTKSKIMELGDRISQGFISGTKLRLLFTNDMGGTFAPVQVVVKLDGYPIYQEKDASKLEKARNMEIFTASILPENHRLDVDMIIRGKGYGIFTYMEAVKMEVSATYYFSAPRGKTITINIMPADRGSIYQLKDRPTIKFKIVE